MKLIQEENGHLIFDENNLLIADCDMPEIAQRLVACVNACAGIPTTLLEVQPKHLDTINRFHIAVAQRDELLAALKALMYIESRGRIMPIGKEWDDARSVIAKAEA